MNLRFQASGQQGYEVIIDNHPALEHINQFGILRLAQGQSYEGDTGPCEAMLHLIEGEADISINGKKFAVLNGRHTPFQGKPAAVYLAPNTQYTVEGEVEVAISHTMAEGNADSIYISPDTLTPNQVGRDNWQRKVTMIAKPDFPSQKLILGETVNPPGNWSGVPTHKHDTARPGIESFHEELYYFRVDRPGGWGIERVYDKNGLDQILLLQDRVVTVMPRGYHTVAAAPGFTLFYTFVLAGPSKTLLAPLDPDQAWIAD